MPILPGVGIDRVIADLNCHGLKFSILLVPREYQKIILLVGEIFKRSGMMWGKFIYTRSSMSMFKFLIVVIPAVALSFTSCTKCSNKSVEESKVATGQVAGTPVIDLSGLKVETLKPGTGAEAQKGKKVTVHYVGKLEDGTEFDSSEKRKTPFTFVLGSGQVIVGWDKGVEGMKIGERRRLKIPSSLGYGAQGVGKVIPPNANLVFEVELLQVE
jgi:peptidylprolyl isomerase